MNTNTSISAGSERENTEKINCCQGFLIACLVLFHVSATGFSIATLASCDFFGYTQKVGNMALETQFADAALGNFTPNITSASFGLFQWSPNMMGCTDYSDPSQLGTAFKAAQAGGIMATTSGLLALFIATVEFICCRFVCARVLMCILLVIGLLGQGLTFVLYASDICLHKGNVVYACDFGSASALSVLATFCFLAGSIFVCPTPKPQPLCKKMCTQRERGSVSDPCCYCFRGKKKDSDEEKAQPEQQAIAENGKDPDQSTSIASKDNAVDNYPKEVYASAHDSDDAAPYGNNAAPVTVSSAASVQTLPPQYHYYAPAQTSFANAEVMDGDLFFDSKTV